MGSFTQYIGKKKTVTKLPINHPYYKGGSLISLSLSRKKSEARTTKTSSPSLFVPQYTQKYPYRLSLENTHVK